MCQVLTKPLNVSGAVNYLDKFLMSQVWEQVFVWAGGAQKPW